MTLFAASAMDTLHTLPADTWVKIGIAIGGLVVAFIVLSKIAGMNKLIMSIVGFVVLTVVFFSWVYNRNEPKFMTPLVEKIAPFFPSAASYKDKQQSTPKP